MFSKSANRILLGVARILESWARIIFERVADESRQDSVEPAVESQDEAEASASKDQDQFGGPDENNEGMSGPVIANPGLQREPPGAIDANASRLRPDDSPATRAISEPTIADAVIPSTRATRRRGFTGLQSGAEDALPPGSESRDEILLESGGDQRQESEQAGSSPAIDANPDEVFATEAKIAGSSSERQDPFERKAAGVEAMGTGAASGSVRQETRVEPGTMRDSSRPDFDRASDPNEPVRPDSAIAPGIEHGQSPDESHDLPLPGNRDLVAAARAEQPGVQAGVGSGEAAQQFAWAPSPETRVVSISTCNDAPPPARPTTAPTPAELRWPRLPGESRRNGDSRSESAAHRWPELPAEPTATWPGASSTETGTAANQIREIERIRYLEREQKGLLWNA